jgi:cell division ATPase FtsA
VLAPDLSFLRLYSLPMAGFEKGKVVDAAKFSTCIRSLVADAKLDQLKHRVIVNIPEIHTRNLVQTIRHRSSGVYRSSDYRSIIDTSTDCASGDLDEVIDTLILSSRLDDLPLNPLAFGSAGRDVVVQLMLATHPKLILADIVAGFNEADVEIAEFRSNGFGLGHGLRALRPNAENSVLLDLGHASTTGCLIVGGVVHQVFSVAAGSHHMTRDLMLGLGCNQEEAESLKLGCGLNRSYDNSSTSDDPFRNWQSMHSFLQPRVSEILALSAKQFAIYSRSLDGGLLMCGNGASLPGLSPHVAKSLGVATPFICQLSAPSVFGFVGIPVKVGLGVVDSGWLSSLSHIRSLASEISACRVEAEARPLSKLRPLWTWLSELSR